MAGIFGIVSKENCINDLFWGTFYLQHRAQNYCGIALYDGEKIKNYTHKGLLRQQFSMERLERLNGFSGIGSVSTSREPVSELSKAGGIIISFDGNLINSLLLRDKLLKEGRDFSGYHDPEEVNDSVLLSKMISKEMKFEKGIEKLISEIKGDFALVALSKEGIYAARGWGRKPLVLGKKNGSYAVASESNAFINLNIEITRDVQPGEIVIINKDGITTIKKFDVKPVQYGTFEWIYTAYPNSVIDGRSVSEVRKKLGKLLAKNYPVEADIVSPIPNSGRWHAVGYSIESKIPYAEAFVRYDYSDRSFTPGEQQFRDLEAKIKLIPIEEVIKGKRIITVDDSIVRGTQTLNQVERLKHYGALEVHARIACPPLMAACQYGKTTKKDEDCIARRMAIKDIREKLKLDSLEYATVEMLEEAIGFSRDMLCLDCWGY